MRQRLETGGRSAGRTAKQAQERELYRWMQHQVADYLDCGEVQLTQLAEAAADAHNCLERLGNPDDVIWELAFRVAEWHERLSEEE